MSKINFILFILAPDALMLSCQMPLEQVFSGLELSDPSKLWGASQVALVVKNPSANAGEMWVRSLGQKVLLEKGLATHSSVLAWRIPWTEEPGRLQSIGSRRVRHN